jgi:hypothetical protein
MHNSETPIIPTEEKTIIFYDDELTAVQLEGGEIYVPVRRLCENLGLDWTAQYRRIMRDEVLREAQRSVAIMATDLKHRFAPEQSEMVCLPLDLVPGWLFGIQTGRVKAEIRPKLIRYRRECFRVLWDAFKDDVLPAMAPELDSPAGELTPAEQNLARVETLYQMARQQVALERWLAQHDHRLGLVEDAALAAHERLDKAAVVVGALQLRVYGPHQVISEAQAAELADLVKHIAGRLGERDPSKNHYQGVWAELHRRYGITTYRRVPADKFGEVVNWLEGWLGTLAAGGD